MKTLLKLLVVAAILNATARVAMAAWDHYQLQDAAQRFVVFGANIPPEQLHAEILSKAVELKLPVRPDDLTVRRDGLRTIATASYTQHVELFPQRTYPIAFSFQVEGLSMR